MPIMLQLLLPAWAVVLLPFVVAAPALNSSTPTITLPYATVIGSVASGVASFKGIPYAQPPVGPLRLKPPQPVSANLGTLLATAVPQACPQFSTPLNVAALPASVLGALGNTTSAPGITNAGEDCLTLNVQTPANVTASSKLPVLLWIYGGGFEQGSTQTYDGSPLITAAQSSGQGYVFVAINYRLGGFGFLPGSDVLRDGSANIGLLDQRMAMEWVADNIESFGGDPEKVTISGESAGAWSTFLQMALYSGNNTYNGKPLFRGAIMDSGSILPTEPIDSPRAELVYSQVLERAGCSNADDGLDCLRALNYTSFLDAANSVPALFSYTGTALSYVPRPDGIVLAASPDILAKTGRFAQVPFIVGDQEYEGTLLALSQTNLTSIDDVVEYFSTVYFQSAMLEQVETLVSFYPASNSSDNIYPQFTSVAPIIGDTTFTLQRRIFLQYASDVPSWSFISSYFNELPVLHTFHGSDVVTIFFLTSGSPTVSVREYYTNFIYNLDPNNGTSNQIHWPQWSEGQQLLNFGLANNTLMDDGFRSEAAEYISMNMQAFYV